MYIWEAKTQNMKKQLLSVFFIFFSLFNIAYAEVRDSVVPKNTILKNVVNPPVNDECGGATNLIVNPTLEIVSFINGTTIDATVSDNNSCYYDPDKKDVWFSFIATSNKHIVNFENISGSASTLRYSLSSGTCDDLSWTYCNSEKVINYLTIGELYYISVSAYTEYTETPVFASFDLSITTPPIPINDECENATVVAINQDLTSDLFVTGSTLGANISLPNEFCEYNYDIWYSFVATSKAHKVRFFDLDDSILGIGFAILKADGCDLSYYTGCIMGQLETSLNNLIIGQAYKIRVYTYNDFESSVDTSSFKLSISTPPPPLNNECNTATDIPVNDSLECDLLSPGTTFGASVSTLDMASCPDEYKLDVWYSFTATSKVHVIQILNQQVGGDNTNFIKYDLFTGNQCEALEQISCNISTPTKTYNNLMVGNIYKIRIYTSSIFTKYAASFDLCITTPPQVVNDECSQATILNVAETVTSYTAVPSTLTFASGSIQTTTCQEGNDDDVWFEFVAIGSRHLINIENAIGSNSLNLNHALFSGNDCENLVALYCSDPNISIATNLIIGQTYKIRVWSSSTLPLSATFDISVLNLFDPIVASTTEYNVQELVNNVLVNNPCVTISNVTSVTGTNYNSVNGIGYFTNTNPLFPINSGIVLSTGNAVNASGPNLTTLNDGYLIPNISNWAGDAQLDAIVLNTTGQTLNSKNASRIDFDFTSLNDFMSFNFVFASEEYGIYQCSYPDSFAFLLTDLTTGTITNLAVVPGTTIPITVQTIRNEENNPSCSSQNPFFFGTLFDGFLAYTSPTNFNGQTTLMTASSAIIPNNPYHIKLIIADRHDNAYDSAVFIEAGSFLSGLPQCNDKIQLLAFIDENNNGTKEDTESNFTYGSFVYQVNNTPDINNASSPIGSYSIYDSNPLNSYDFSYEVYPEYDNYFSSGTITHNDISIAVGSGTQTLYFPITQIQSYNDVTVSIVPIGQPTAGFSYTNKIVYTNLGTTTTSGTINYSKDPLVTVSSTQTGVVNTTDGFTYDFSGLAPFETRSFYFTINVPSIPVVNIDDVLESSVAVSAPTNDINSAKNTFTNAEIVVASYDPNDKMEAHGDKLDFNNFNQDDYLFYTIRFQNTGTANAVNIRIEDLLDAQLDEESIRMVSASHNYVMERVGNKLVWKFDYIYLPSHLANEELSNGYLTFKIKVKPGFQVGDIIPNFAEIYFDTNPAIVTNTFTSTFQELLGTPPFSAGNINVYPNPSNGLVHINIQNTLENLSTIKLYDVLGKMIISSKSLTSKQSTLDVSALSKGIYMIEITTENNLKQMKKLVVN
ncbi:MAG: T9SS type A sorting domain-containing protein [Flavobacterium sp.]|nr:MAG: T9SS type A sorting domain-containing protein [Flavobacterium sp.]